MENIALRYNKGKPPLSYILEMPNAIKGVARVMEYGATKYDRGNWQKGLLYLGVIDSLLRHLTAFTNGEDMDAESGQLHIDLAATNALFLAEYVRTHPELDNRAVHVNEKT